MACAFVKIAAVFWLGAAALPGWAWAQGAAENSAQSAPPAADGSATRFDDLIVTARKRSEIAQTVPISLSVYDQTALDRLDIKSIYDLRTLSPSVYIATSTFRQDTINIAIRGQQNFQSTGLQFDTATAVYVDGVYYARPVGLNGSLFDVSSVEVLKGPQGTLVGRNSTGGAILYHTIEAGPDLGGYVRATLGDYGHKEVQAAVNAPLTSTLFLRAAFSDSVQEGYIKNYFYDPATGFRNTEPGMGYRKQAANLSLKWQPDGALTAGLRFNIAGENDTGTTYHDLGYFVGTVAATGAKPSICNIPATCTGFTDLLGHVIAPYYSSYTSAAVNTVNTAPAAYNALLNSVAREQQYGFWSTEQAVNNGNVGQYRTLSAYVDKAFGEVDAKLTTAYRWWNTQGSATSRGLPYATNIFLYQTPNYQSYQSELTFNGSSFAQRLKWTAGLFFFRETSPQSDDQLYLFLPSGITPTAASGKQITYTDPLANTEANTSYAGYAQATYALAPDTRLTAGVRYTVDERFAHVATQTIRTPASPATTASVVNGVYNPAALVLNGISYSGQTLACALTDTNGNLQPLSACALNIDRTYRKPTWTLAIDHDLFDKTLVYATARSGYRAGAINTGAINPNAMVALPEQVQDYEIGIKADWSVMHTPVRTNIALYYTDYSDIQIQTALPNVTLASVSGTNAPCTQTAYNAGQCVGVSSDNVTLNARSARVRGAEWDLTVRPIRDLTLAAAGSYLDAVYTNYSFTPPAGYLLASGATNLSGSPFPLPRWQANATAIYTLPWRRFGRLSFDGIELTAHTYYQSSYQAYLAAYNAAQRTSDYAMTNARIDFRNAMGGKLDFSLHVDNLFNKQACLPEPQGVLNSAPNATFGTAGASGVLQCVPLPPRMAGASLSYRF